MKFAPRGSQIIGRMTIRRSESKIIRIDESKVTKFVLVDAVGPDAAAKGVKVGDLLIVTTLRQIVLDAGMVYLPMAEEKDIALFVTDVTLDELLIQTASGKDFVSFDSPDAAKSLGATPKTANGNTNVVAGAPV